MHKRIVVKQLGLHRPNFGSFERVLRENSDVSLSLFQSPFPLIVIFRLEKINLIVSTPINIPRLDHELQQHPNRRFVTFLLAGLRIGFHTGIQHIPKSIHEGQNLRSARKSPDIVSKVLSEEVEKGFLIGPFHSSPFPVYRISPLGLVFGKYSEKPRLILDLSWPHDTSQVSSINDLIDKDECSLTYATIDDAIQSILLTGRNSFLCKCDITAAFKLIPIRPDLVPFYGCRWDNQLFFFVRLPFGGRSSPRIFDCLSIAVEWIIINNYGFKRCQHLLDDFLTVDSTKEEGLRTMSIQTMLFEQLGIPLSLSKTIGPLTSLVYLGVVLDTSLFATQIPLDKIQRMSSLIREFSNKKRCTKRELLQLIGHFNFATRVIVPSRSFMSYLFQLSCTVKELYFHVRIGKEARIDLAMWGHFLTNWNCHYFFLDHDPVSNADLCLFTDAAGGVGYGGLFRSHWFASSWSDFLRIFPHTRSSSLLELIPIVSAAFLWGAQWSRRRILFYCDNEALVFILNKRRSSDSTIMLFVRRLTLLSLHHNFHIIAKHIPGASNDIADALSRHQWSRFRRLAPWADVSPCPTPTLDSLMFPSSCHSFHC